VGVFQNGGLSYQVSVPFEMNIHCQINGLTAGQDIEVVGSYGMSCTKGNTVIALAHETLMVGLNKQQMQMENGYLIELTAKA
jgi:hypothetical protein